jgi:outer membrane protein OmpA-like peptidoglycan-associated protein
MNTLHRSQAAKFAGLCAISILVLGGCATPPSPPLPAPIVVAPIPVYTGPTLPIEQSDRGVQIFLPSAVLFDIGKAEFKAADAAPYLDRVAHLLKTKTTHKISIEGHTDNAGSAASNQALSLARATSLQSALSSRGIPADRLNAVGFSFNRPIASNATDEGKKLNRRVELVILDEKVENITKGEAPNAFESAWANLRSMIERGLVKSVESK